MTDRAPLSAPDAIVVHIGPYKTGTTAVQMALDAHRDEMAELGVLYPGTYHRQMRQSWALLGRSRVGSAAVPAAEWDEMVAECHAAPGRVVISSEDFASSRPENARKLVADLGPDRVSVLITARRLDRLLPSAWQERVKSTNETRTYDAWLREVLDPGREGAAAETFWRNHGLQTLIDLWTSVLPPERVLVLVNDEDDHGHQPRSFEQILGLPDGLLTPGPHQNTSLSLDRIEFYRTVNERVAERGWTSWDQLTLMRRSMLVGLRQAPRHPDERSIPPLPRWAAERVAELSRHRSKTVGETAATVIGDPGLLLVSADAETDELAEIPALVPMDAAAGAIEGLFAAMEKRARRRRRQQRARLAAPATPGPATSPTRPAAASPEPLDGVATRALLGEAGRRVTRRLGRAAGRRAPRS